MKKTHYLTKLVSQKLFRLLCIGLIGFLISTGNLSAQSIIIGTGTSTSNGSASDPIDGFFQSMRYQTVYTATELSAAGLTGGSNLTALGFSISEDYAGGVLGNYTIRLAHTSATNAASHISATLTEVRSPFSYNPVATAAGSFDMISFTTNFTWDGVSNILVDICTGNSNAFVSPYGGVRTNALTSGSRRVRCDGCGSQCSVNTNTANTDRPQIRFDYTAGGPCAGTPTPGNTLSSTAAACFGTNFTLSLQNSTPGSGVSYQWYTTPDGTIGNGVPIGGATNASYTTSQSSATYYFAKVTCAGNDGYSTPLQVGMANYLTCYCSTSYSNGTGSGDYIGLVQIPGTSLNNPSTGAPSPYYTLYPTSGSTTASLQQSVQYTLMLDGGTWSTAYLSAWIDWNMNGVLEVSEFLGSSVNVGGSNPAAGFTFTVPISGNLGLTRLRVRSSDTSPGPPSNTACGITNSTYGETEDYNITITPPPPCVDPPTAGNIITNKKVVCPSGSSFTLSLAGGTSGAGQTYQWQSSTDGVNFTDIGGEVNPTYSGTEPAVITYYQVVVTCGSGSSTASPIAIHPCNDNVCNSYVVQLGNNAGPFTNAGATVEPGEPTPPMTTNLCTDQGFWCDGSPAANTIWFSYTVPANGSGRYFVAAPAWDSQVAIWSASTCSDILSGSAVLMGANDDSAGSPYNAYARAFCLIPGQTYYIQVDGYSGTTNSNISIRIDDAGFANSSFTGLPATGCEADAAYTLTPAVGGGTFSGTGVSGNSFDPGVAGPGEHIVTYTLAAPNQCYFTADTIVVAPVNATFYADFDNDSYGDPNSGVDVCDGIAPSGYVADNTDCNDNDPAINPAATEICNSIDDNCDGTIDEGFDVDNDGYTTCEGDCNDNDNTVYPGATELCNGVDDDCNTLVDDGLTFVTYYADNDGDTYGDPVNTVSTCDGPPSGYVSDNTDCNDANANANPAGVEVCNGIDDDCDGLTDEDVLPDAGPISGPAVQCVAVVTGSATFSIDPVFDATSYNWVLPAGMQIISGQGTNSIFVFWTPAAVQTGIIGNLTVTASNACGSGDPSSVAVDINYTPPVTPPSISGPSKVCPGETVVYSISNVARASSYTWSLPPGLNILSGQGTNIINVAVDGGYTGGIMNVVASNACGSSPQRVKNLGLNIPTAPAAIVGNNSGVCGQSGVSYSTAGIASATSYLWTAPAGATIMSGQGTSSITVDFSGSYTSGPITVRGVNGCGNGAIRSLTVTGAPGQPGPINGPTAICPNQSGVIYDVNTVTGADSYTWTVPGGATITNGQGTKTIEVTYGPAPATGQIITVKASNDCGTSSTRILSGITIAFTNCIRLGDASVSDLNVYPNPANDLVNISFTAVDGDQFSIRLMDVAGRTINTETGTAVEGNNLRRMVTSGYASGVYLLEVELNGNAQQIRLMID